LVHIVGRGPFRGWGAKLDFFRSRRAVRGKSLIHIRARLEQFAEKLVVAVAFGWRSGLPLRQLVYFHRRL
jgi:hypothetical protein